MYEKACVYIYVCIVVVLYRSVCKKIGLRSYSLASTSVVLVASGRSLSEHYICICRRMYRYTSLPGLMHKSISIRWT